MQIEERHLTTIETRGGTLLAAIRAGDGQAICVFKSGFARDELTDVDGFTIEATRSIGSGLVVVGRAEGGVIPLPLRGGEQAPVLAQATGLFEGLNTVVAFRGVESAEVIGDWLGYYQRHHGLEAALIVDRLAPGPSSFPRALPEVDGIKRVVVLTLDVPTGHADRGAEVLPFLAPDAPGKDRMQPPEPDPWRAPFAEIVLYELLRHLWLGTARGVLNLDPSDLLPPGNVFDIAEGAPHGVAVLDGRRAYPWALRPGQAAHFRDHVCHRFDGRPSNPRWCIAPRTARPDVIWRMLRIIGVPGEKSPVLPYWRCMALRHPTENVAEIVPKAALVEEAGLRALVAGFGGPEARRPPAAKARVESRTNRTGIVTTMKNEGPFILEWLAYHRAIGVEQFLVFTNDCTDGTDTLLDLLERKGLVRRRENPFRETGGRPQHAALQAADADAAVQALDWVVCMDVDEFINIHVGDGTLEALYGVVPEANMISMTWRLFGNAGIDAFADAFVTRQFTRCAPEFIRKPHQAWGFKTLARNTGVFRKLGVHRPKGLRPQLVGALNWVNGSGRAMPLTAYRSAWRSTQDTYGYDLVTLNHYAVRSAESFLVKRDRGRVNHVERDQGLNYWFRMNNNAEEDLSIQARLPAAQAEFDRLMADPEIAAAHGACVAAHRAKIAELLGTPKYAAFYEEITGDRMGRLSRMHRHFGANVFLQGPDCLPDDVLAHAGEERFFFRGPPVSG
ncbi:MAG: glycosyltransferase family 2 protein [Pseudomonadota bacterium]